MGKGVFKIAENHKLVEMDRGGIRCMVKKINLEKFTRKEEVLNRFLFND